MTPQTSWIPVLIVLPTMVPLLAAAVTLLAGRSPTIQRAVSVSAIGVALIASGLMLYLTSAHGTFAVNVGGWDGRGIAGTPLGITLVVDRLAALMLVISLTVLLCVVVYAIGQGIRDGTTEQPVSIFLPTYLILTAGVCNSFLAGDLFNLYVSFEVLLAASFVLLTLGASAERVRAGASYIMVSMVSSLIFLAGIAFAYATTGTLNLAEM
ncbi:proton-conducting transporter transmembrane domain-containing protein, partial [Gordonia sihwensis]